MKLLNKNTGKIGEGSIVFTPDSKVKVAFMIDSETGECITLHISYNNLDELSKNFEIVKKTYPLIKDEKIRKAVRAWWECIPDSVIDKRIIYKANHDLAIGTYTIYCGEIFPIGTLKEGKYYTITELCGEEEK